MILTTQMFACLFMLVAVAVCVDMPPKMTGSDPPKDGAKPDAARQNPQTPPARPDGATPRADGKLDLPKAENPKPDLKTKRSTH